MAYAVQLVITEARGLLQDTAAVRYSNADLLQYMNDCLDVMADHLPFLFNAFATFTCVDGARQTFPSAGSKGVIDVPTVVGGNTVVRADLNALDNFAPTWRRGRRLPTANWSPIVGSRYEFLVYPPASAGQLLSVQHVATPQEYTIGLTLDERVVPYTNLLVEYVCALAEMRESEGAGPEREQMFISQFVTKLKGIPA